MLLCAQHLRLGVEMKALGSYKEKVMKFSFDSEVLAYNKTASAHESRFPQVTAYHAAGQIFQTFLLLPNLLGERACALIDLVQVRLSLAEATAEQTYRIKTSFKIIITAGETSSKIDLGFDVSTDHLAYKNDYTLATYIVDRIRSHVEMYTSQESTALKNLYDLFREAV